MAGLPESHKPGVETLWPELPIEHANVARDGYLEFLLGMSVLTYPDSRFARLATGVIPPYLQSDRVVRTAAKHAGRGLLRVVAALNKTNSRWMMRLEARPYEEVLPYAEGTVADVQRLYESRQRELDLLDGDVIRRGVLPIRDQEVYEALCAGELRKIGMKKIAEGIPVAYFLLDALGRYALDEALEHA